MNINMASKCAVLIVSVIHYNLHSGEFFFEYQRHLTKRAADERESARSKLSNKQSSPAWWCTFPAHR